MNEEMGVLQCNPLPSHTSTLEYQQEAPGLVCEGIEWILTLAFRLVYCCVSLHNQTEVLQVSLLQLRSSTTLCQRSSVKQGHASEYTVQ